jgi:hypothetical protein
MPWLNLPSFPLRRFKNIGRMSLRWSKTIWRTWKISHQIICFTVSANGNTTLISQQSVPFAREVSQIVLTKKHFAASTVCRSTLLFCAMNALVKAIIKATHTDSFRPQEDAAIVETPSCGVKMGSVLTITVSPSSPIWPPNYSTSLTDKCFSSSIFIFCWKKRKKILQK